jgi:hypothetical protein
MSLEVTEDVVLTELAFEKASDWDLNFYNHINCRPQPLYAHNFRATK